MGFKEFMGSSSQPDKCRSVRDQPGEAVCQKCHGILAKRRNNESRNRFGDRTITRGCCPVCLKNFRPHSKHSEGTLPSDRNGNVRHAAYKKFLLELRRSMTPSAPLQTIVVVERQEADSLGDVHSFCLFSQFVTRSSRARLSPLCSGHRHHGYANHPLD